MKVKKLLFPLITLLGLFSTSAMLVSCDDDDDNMPNVDVRVNVENATVVDGNIYVVEGNEFSIASITVTNNIEGKAALITSASYYWDFDFVGTNYLSPFGLKIFTGEYTGLGEHLLQINCPVYAVDKAPAIAYLQYNVVVVKDQSEIPSGNQYTFIDGSASMKKGDTIK